MSLNINDFHSYNFLQEKSLFQILNGIQNSYNILRRKMHHTWGNSAPNIDKI